MKPFFEHLSTAIRTPPNHKQAWAHGMNQVFADQESFPSLWHDPIPEGPTQGWTAWTWAAWMKWRHPTHLDAFEWEKAWRARTGEELRHADVETGWDQPVSAGTGRTLTAHGLWAVSHWRYLVKRMSVVRVGGREPEAPWRFSDPRTLEERDLSPLLSTVQALLKSPKLTNDARCDLASLMLTLCFPTETWANASFASEPPWIPIREAFAALPAAMRWDHIENWLSHAPCLHLGNQAALGWPRQLSTTEVESWYQSLNEQMLTDLDEGMEVSPTLWKTWTRAVQQNVAHAAHLYLSQNMDCRPSGETGFFPLLRRAQEKGLTLDWDSWFTTADQVSPMYSTRLQHNLAQAKIRDLAKTRMEDMSAVEPVPQAARPRRLRS